jgi:hypothetical protein
MTFISLVLLSACGTTAQNSTPPQDDESKLRINPEALKELAEYVNKQNQDIDQGSPTATEAITQNTCLTSLEGLWHDVPHPLKTHQTDREVHLPPLPWL